jgi:glc operon protein GlcG
MSTDGLSLEAAQKLIANSFNLAKEANTAVATVVTDAAGGLIAGARMDGVGAIAISIATRKAATAAAFKAPLGALLGMISKDDLTMRALGSLDELLLLPGATPVMAGGKCVGAIGIAGAHHSQDQAMADQAVATG